MPVVKKIKPLIAAYWFTFLLLFIILSLYGRDIIGWFLTKLFEILIWRNEGSL